MRETDVQRRKGVPQSGDSVEVKLPRVLFLERECLSLKEDDERVEWLQQSMNLKMSK